MNLRPFVFTKYAATANQLSTRELIPAWLKASTNFPPLITAIDPSVNSLGIAVFELVHSLESIAIPKAQEAMETGKLAELLDYYYALTYSDTITTELEGSKHQYTNIVRIMHMVQRVEETVQERTPFGLPGIVIIEEPESWGSYKTLASEKAGDMKLLIMTVGALAYWASTVANETILIPVSKWKGQLPKNVTHDRMKKAYKLDKVETYDETDAIGIGHYFIGKYLIPAAKRTGYKMRRPKWQTK